MKNMAIVLMAMLGVCCNMNGKTTSYTSTTTDRDVKNFDAIEVSGGIDLYVSQGAEESATVTASSEELVERTRTEVENGVLKIYLEDKGWNWSDLSGGKIKVTVTFKDINDIEASGACNVKAGNTLKEKDLKVDLSGASEFSGDVAVENLDLETSGAANIKVNGIAEKTDIGASGAGTVRGFDLRTDFCSVDASGAANIKITVMKELNVDASGGSSITYKGTGVLKSDDTSGGASVRKEDD